VGLWTPESCSQPHIWEIGRKTSIVEKLSAVFFAPVHTFTQFVHRPLYAFVLFLPRPIRSRPQSWSCTRLSRELYSKHTSFHPRPWPLEPKTLTPGPLTPDPWPLTLDPWPLTPDPWPLTPDLWPLTPDPWPLTLNTQVSLPNGLKGTVTRAEASDVFSPSQGEPWILWILDC
jgi:hypothetical protein